MATGVDESQKDMVLINQGLQSEIKKLQEQLFDEKKIRQNQLGKLRKEADDAKKGFEMHKKDAYSKDREIEKAKIDLVKKSEEAQSIMQKLEQKMELERQKHERLLAQNQ